MPFQSIKLRLGPAAVLVMTAGALAACGVADFSGNYPGKGDWKPHPGVVTALNYPIHGIDVSRYQTDIDWAAVRNAGTRFVFIKATEGGDYIDPRFVANWNGARAAGIPAGAYHFVFWCRPAHEQAQWFVQHIPNDPNALPPVLDLEWNTSSRTCPRKVAREIAIEKALHMLQELERHTGKIPVIYTDITFHREVLEGERAFDRYPFWLRSVAARPEERYNGRRWAFWQYTATGRIPGIRGGVDRNAFYGTEQEFTGWVKGDFDIAARHWKQGRQPQQHAPKPAPQPSAQAVSVASATPPAGGASPAAAPSPAVVPLDEE